MQLKKVRFSSGIVVHDVNKLNSDIISTKTHAVKLLKADKNSLLVLSPVFFLLFNDAVIFSDHMASPYKTHPCVCETHHCCHGLHSMSELGL